MVKKTQDEHESASRTEDDRKKPLVKCGELPTGQGMSGYFSGGLDPRSVKAMSGPVGVRWSGKSSNSKKRYW